MGTWTLGDINWIPRNRPTVRRIQNMGWTSAGAIWLSSRGGEVLLSLKKEPKGTFYKIKILTSGYGILDVELKSGNISYACGGSGIHFKSEDDGLIWEREKDEETIPGNLYSIKFVTTDLGFLLGSEATLLRLEAKN